MNANWGSSSATALEASVNKFCGRHLEGIISVSFSPDDSKVASGRHDKIVKVWDSTSMSEIKSLSGHTDQINSVCFSDTVKVWDAETYKVIKTLTNTGYVLSACFSPDSLSILALGFGQINKTMKGHGKAVKSVESRE
jgi:WD40 repeat protein